jgi:hypothetical protein
MRAMASAALLCALIDVATPSAQQRIGGGAGVPQPGRGSGDKIVVLRSEPLDIASPVVDAPFSADTLTVSTQVFADGNRIEQRTEGSVARDSSGTIYRVQMLAGLGGAAEPIRIVTITSAAERVQYRLDEARKVAVRMHLPPSLEAPERPDAGVEQLQPMQYEGLRADGTRSIVVIPVGRIGNQRPIEIVNERWYSPELQVVVQTRRADPRFGEVLYKLVNISRATPPKQLFEIPADFVIEDQRPVPTLQRRPQPDQAGQP